MKIRKIALLLLIAFPSVAASLPVAGTCKLDQEVAGINFGTAVTWKGSDATVATGGNKLSGNVVGLRDHSGGFKLSVRYEDPIMGLSEIIIFEMPSSEPPVHRMATVTYDMVENGERVVSSVNPFEDAVCAVLE
ncbi:MAG: hypothetical protein ACU0DX_02625 [Roseovarius sp.]|uniref:hypothetical protein n=1 Tax=Roseovarius sp. TaxID=1486281 RepID=UPI00261D6308|nr:hypothetical protein [Roseovarius sp.]